MNPELLDELRTAPYLIVTRHRPRLQRLAHRAMVRGELVTILPGTFAAPDVDDLTQCRATALSLVHPDAVVSGRAAARLTWWPALEAPVLDATYPTALAPAPGFRWTRGRVPAELVVVVNGIRLTDPALTVLDLLPEMGGRVIDEALRLGAVTLDRLWEAFALTPQRPGNQLRRDLLVDSRDEPWSEAERTLHRAYRGSALPWRHATNYRVDLLGEGFALLDLALPELRLGFEVDGEEAHRSRAGFRRDRRRDPELVEQGWLIVRFAAVDLEDDLAWVCERMVNIAHARAIELGVAPRRPKSDATQRRTRRPTLTP